MKQRKHSIERRRQRMINILLKHVSECENEFYDKLHEPEQEPPYRCERTGDIFGGTV